MVNTSTFDESLTPRKCFALYRIINFETWVVCIKVNCMQRKKFVCTQIPISIMCTTHYRSPVPSQRLNFSDISRQLSLPDTKLLQWSEEDRAIHPEAIKLGADLLCGQELHKDYRPDTDEETDAHILPK